MTLGLVALFAVGVLLGLTDKAVGSVDVASPIPGLSSEPSRFERAVMKTWVLFGVSALLTIFFVFLAPMTAAEAP